jgi:hypothetical protein
VDRTEPDEIGDALAGRYAEALHPHHGGRGVLTDEFHDPVGPGHMAAVVGVEWGDGLEWIAAGEPNRDGPAIERAPDREHVIGHARRVLERIAPG